MKKLTLEGNKLLHHLDRLEPWLEGREIYPLYALVSPSLTCNQSCSFCVYRYLDRRRPRFLEASVLAPVLREMGGCGVRGMLFSGEGEPLLNRECADMVEAAAAAGIDTALNTNGALFSRGVRDRMLPLLTWIRFSVDAGDAATYSLVHGTPKAEFRKVLGIIEAAASEAARLPEPPTLGVQFLLLRENIESLPALAGILASIGVDYLAVKPFLKHPRILANGLSSRREAGISVYPYNPYIDETLSAAESASTGEFEVMIRREAFRGAEGRSYKTCPGADFLFEIDSAGNLIPCGPLMGEPEFFYGNIHDAGFREIWSGEKCRSLRKRLREEFDVGGCMPGCRNDSVNRFLWGLRHPPSHLNFI